MSYKRRRACIQPSRSVHRETTAPVWCAGPRCDGAPAVVHRPGPRPSFARSTVVVVADSAFRELTSRRGCVAGAAWLTLCSMTQRTTAAQLRAQAEEELRPLGQRRVQLVTELETLNEELRPLVIRAVEAGVSYRRVGELTGLSRNTVGGWWRLAEEAQR